jgi:hypothetical protein
MDTQQTLVELEAAPVESGQPQTEPAMSQKLVFGQRRGKGRPEPQDKPLENPKLKPINRDQFLMRTVDLEQLLKRTIRPGQSGNCWGVWI